MDAPGRAAHTGADSWFGRTLWPQVWEDGVSDPNVDTTAETGTLELRITSHGRVIGRELYESEDQALLAVEAWSDFEGVECEITDLSAARGHGDGDTEPVEEDLEDYSEELELERAASDAARMRD